MSTAKRYRALLVTALLSSSSLLSLLPAFADQNSPTPGSAIQNQATAEFQDAADNQTVDILSNTVSITVAEVAGISASGLAITNQASRGNTVFFDFKVKNEGNDPTQLFVPGAPSSVTIGGVAIPAGNIGPLSVIEYNNVTTTTGGLSIPVPAAGGATGSLTGFPTGSGGSVPAGGYITVRVPITLPNDARTNDTISVTLGNTSIAPIVGAGVSNEPLVANGVSNPSGKDLYTQDNSGTTNTDASGAPINGEREASAVLTTQVVNPNQVTISGTVWDDANGSAAPGGVPGFTGIQNGLEVGAVIPTSTPLYALLVDIDNKVLDSQPVRTAATANAANPVGSYKLTALGVQSNVRVILSTTPGAAFVAPASPTTIVSPGLPAPATGVPVGWAATSPLSYTPFAISTSNINAIDFGIELLPETAPASQSGINNPPGVTTKYQVPTLTGTDTDPTATPITSFQISTIPAPAQGILSYNTGTLATPVYTPVIAGQIIQNYDPARLVFDPVDGVVNMSFTYASVDEAGKVDPTPATVAMSFNAANVTITGKVYNDRNGSIAGTSNNGTAIAANPAGADVGTDSKFGTTQVAVNAVLVDANGVALQASVVVDANGNYTFTGVPPSTQVKVVLSATPVAVGATPTGTAPVGWVGTSPKITAGFNTGLFPVTSATNDVDFGIRQKAKLVLLKRITKVNGATTNPNDGTVLSNVVTDAGVTIAPGAATSADGFNSVGNWKQDYVVGNTRAGLVKPNDTIEYTVYFLNNQGSDAQSVKLCDPIKGAQDFLPNSISLQLGTSAATPLPDSNSYSNANPPTDCFADSATSLGAPNGGVRIPLGTAVSGATGVATPSASYGKFSFTTRVKP